MSNPETYPFGPFHLTLIGNINGHVLAIAIGSDGKELARALSPGSGARPPGTAVKPPPDEAASFDDGHCDGDDVSEQFEFIRLRHISLRPLRMWNTCAHTFPPNPDTRTSAQGMPTGQASLGRAAAWN